MKYDSRKKFNYCVYLHIRKDTNYPFYVGKGSRKRAFDITNRNKWWHNVVNKAGGFYVVLLRVFKKERFALEFEKKTQDLLIKKSIPLTNILQCGQKGSNGYKHTEEAITKIRNSSKKMWENPKLIKEAKERLSGLNNPFSDKRIYLFYHKTHGYLKCSQFELRIKYDLSSSHLSQMIKKKRYSVNGWALCNEKSEYPIIGSDRKKDKRIFFWTHPIYGNRKCNKHELIQEFNHLNRHNLSHLIAKNQNTHFNWKCYAS